MALDSNSCGSYPREIFLEEVDPDTLCPVCLGVCRDPVVCKDGHSFCKTCLEEAMKKTFNKCPLDRAYIGGQLPTKNRPLQNIIGRMRVKCPSSFGSNGSGMCKWTGKLDELGAHENSCAMRLRKCKFDGCQVVIYAYELQQHQQQCRFRKESCQDCTSLVPVSCMEEHTSTLCPFKKTDCPNRCTAPNVVRGNVLTHLRNGCEEGEIDCPMECGAIVKFGNIPEHFQNNARAHVNFMYTKLLEARDSTSITSDIYDNPILQWRLDEVHQVACSPAFESHTNTITLYLREMELYIKMESKIGLQMTYTSGIVIMKSAMAKKKARWEWTKLARNKTLKVTGLLDKEKKYEKIDIICALRFGF